MEKILVSACLLGSNCKYNGKNNASEVVIKLKNKFELIPVCPEVTGGLPTPRIPCEIKDRLVYNRIGLETTSYFVKGAKEELLKAKQNNVKYAILKEKSPSCGVRKIYDGSFSKTLIEGQGIFTRMLVKQNIKVYSEDEIDIFLKDYEEDHKS